MRSQPTTRLEAYRFHHPTLGAGTRGKLYGAFLIPCPGAKLHVISSGESHTNMPWEHVSVSVYGVERCPTWDEMSLVKDLFWLPTETVVQFHPPRSKHINHHKFCLHLWRDVRVNYELPPSWTIA